VQHRRADGVFSRSDHLLVRAHALCGVCSMLSVSLEPMEAPDMKSPAPGASPIYRQAANRDVLITGGFRVRVLPLRRRAG
jgi:hypothetical protein